MEDLTINIASKKLKHKEAKIRCDTILNNELKQPALKDIKNQNKILNIFRY